MENILILNGSPEETQLLEGMSQQMGKVSSAADISKAKLLIETKHFAVILADAALADHSLLKGSLEESTCLIITGENPKKIKEVMKTWPLTRYLDSISPIGSELDPTSFERTVKKAIEYSRLKSSITDLETSKQSAELKLREVYSKIKDIGSSFSGSILKELEKRIQLKASYLKFQTVKTKIEHIIRKIYAANDVSNLLDIVYDIKDLLLAGGITLSIIDENDTLGKYLKPLVWEDAFLSHSDFGRYIALIEDQDFAAVVARTGTEINITDISEDKRFSKRYREQLRSPLRNLLCTPIKYEKEVIGVIEVLNKKVSESREEKGFTKEDQQNLQNLSEHIAMAMTKLNLIQYDALTGLLRPDPFFEKVILKIESQSKRRQEEGAFAMVMGDVDWFKNYNDRNGHETGNKLLRELAKVLKSSIREDDLLCRYGGEEFLFFLTGVINSEEASILTERIRKKVELNYFQFQEFQPRNNLTMSFGVTILPRDKSRELSTISKSELKQIANEADIALAEAKGDKFHGIKIHEKNGDFFEKNKVCVYLPHMEKRVELDDKEKIYREKRTSERFFISAPLIYRENGSHKVTHTINLSLGGVKISSDKQLPLEKTIDLFLILGAKANQLRGDVVYSEKIEGNSHKFQSGLKFRDLSPSDRKFLQEYFYLLSKK